MARKPRSNAVSTPATIALDRAGVQYITHAYVHDARNHDYGSESSRALGIPPERIFKTLMIEGQGQYAVALIPVSAQASLKRVAQELGLKKCQLTDVRTAENLTGYVTGGISPFGQKTKKRTLIDESALQWDTIYVSGGRRGLSIEISPQALICVIDDSVVTTIT